MYPAIHHLPALSVCCCYRLLVGGRGTEWDGAGADRDGMGGSPGGAGRSGDVGLDRAAWGALQGSNYPPLPKDFHGPYLELRALFMYNMQQ